MNTEKVPAKTIQPGDRIKTLSAGVCTVMTVGTAPRNGYLSFTFDKADPSYVPPNYPVNKVVED